MAKRAGRLVIAVTIPRGLRLAVVAMAGISTACGVSSEPAPPPEPSISISRPGPDYAVGKVADPLDIERYASRPCELIPTAVADELKVAVEDEAASDTCRWASADDRVKTGIHAAARVNGGLQDKYDALLQADEVTGVKASWEPTEVAGYPAAFTITEAGAKLGACALIIGVSDDQVLRIEGGRAADDRPIGWEQAEASCELLVDVAEAIIEHVRDDG